MSGLKITVASPVAPLRRGANGYEWLNELLEFTYPTFFGVLISFYPYIRAFRLITDDVVAIYKCIIISGGARFYLKYHTPFIIIIAILA